MADITYLPEHAALAVSRGGLREAVKVLEKTSEGGLNQEHINTAARVVEHIGKVLAHHVRKPSTALRRQRPKSEGR